MLAELESYQEKAFPAHIDQRFAALAAARVAADPLWHNLGLRVVRTWNTWFNPRNSAGWPVDVPPSEASSKNGVNAAGTARMIELALAYPLSALTRGATALYRIGLLAGLLAALVLSMRANAGSLRPIIWAAGIVTLGRILLYAWFDVVESRYALGSVPGIEIALCLLIIHFFDRGRDHYQRDLV